MTPEDLAIICTKQCGQIEIRALEEGAISALSLQRAKFLQSYQLLTQYFMPFSRKQLVLGCQKG